MRCLLLIAVTVAGLLASPCRSADPASELNDALVDMAAVPQEQRRSIRYVSLYNVQEAERDNVTAVLGFVVNSISSAPTIIPVTRQGSLVRLVLEEYGIRKEAWESLVSQSEPYWHIKSKAINPTTGKTETVYTDAGHVGLKAAAELRAATGSGGAIVRADWFIFKATQPTAYYDFTNTPKTIDGWYKGLGADPKTIVALNANRGANLFRSGVTGKPRRLSRWQGPLGGVWQTYDSADNDDPNKDPFRNPTYGGEYEAVEAIATKANGLHVFALYNAKGERQDSVPDTIAKDDSDNAGDGRLVPMLSCVRCHVEDGLRPFANDMKAIVASGVGVETTAGEAARLASFYSTDRLEKEAARDREDYAEAVKASTGNRMESKALPAALAKVVREFGYEQVTNRMVMEELGVRTLAGLADSRDPYLLAIFVGKPINRSAWEASFPEASILCRGDK